MKLDETAQMCLLREASISVQSREEQANLCSLVRSFSGHLCGEYCKFGNFRENFIFANSINRHICDVKPSSVNDRVISPFREDFIFTKLRICEVSRK